MVERSKKSLPFAQIITSTTEDIFASMIFLELTSGEPLTEGKTDLGCFVTAMIGLSGDFNAILGIHCPAKVGTAIGGAMLGIELEEVDDDIKDALGEIANMLAGGLKEAFTLQQVNLMLAIPTTISGSSYKISAPAGGERILIPFDVAAGRFYIDIKYSLT
jgi:chemotaxis protein CheX